MDTETEWDERMTLSDEDAKRVVGGVQVQTEPSDDLQQDDELIFHAAIAKPKPGGLGAQT